MVLLRVGTLPHNLDHHHAYGRADDRCCNMPPLRTSSHTCSRATPRKWIFSLLLFSLFSLFKERKHRCLCMLGNLDCVYMLSLSFSCWSLWCVGECSSVSWSASAKAVHPCTDKTFIFPDNLLKGRKIPLTDISSTVLGEIRPLATPSNVDRRFVAPRKNEVVQSSRR